MGRYIEQIKILPKESGIAIDLENYNELYPAMHYLITFAMGLKIREPIENAWDRKLEQYLIGARKVQKSDVIYKTVSKVMNHVSLGVRRK